MKRKEFIRNISLIGACISLAPTRLFASSSNSKIALPSATTHIPHGNFADANTERIQILELNIEVSVQRFMRNGITDCRDDLTVYTIERGSEMVLISSNESGVIVTGSIEGLCIEKSDSSFSLSTKSHRMEIRDKEILVSQR